MFFACKNNGVKGIDNARHSHLVTAKHDLET